MTYLGIFAILIGVVLSCHVIYWDEVLNFFPSDTSILPKIQRLKNKWLIFFSSSDMKFSKNTFVPDFH
jgi:hypothetical protein